MISRGTAVSIDLDQRDGSWRIYELTWLCGYGGTVELSGLDRTVLQRFPALGAFNLSDFFQQSGQARQATNGSGRGGSEVGITHHHRSRRSARSIRC